ncbi:MAG: hypothetical protein AAGA21_22240 [Pseudomonadota bacterium]
MSNLTLLHLVLIASAMLAAVFCCVQLLRLHRVIKEFKTYSADKRSSADDDGTSASIVRAVFDQAELDKHQKILRTETIFTGGSAAMLMGWLLVVSIVI